MPSKKDYGQPTRRSGRLRAASVASSAASADHGACATGAREEKGPVKGPFDTVVACDQLVAGETILRAALTKAQLTAIVEAFVTRERDLKDRVAELAAERDAAVEKLARRRDLESAFREQQLVVKMAEIAARKGASPTSSPAVVLSEHTSPAPASLPEPSDLPVVAATTATATTAITSASSSTATPTPIPSWRRLAASIGGYLSPFAGRSPSKQVPQSEPPAARSDEPLGELTPAARKRGAPEEETPRQVRTPSAFLGPSSRNPQQPTSLSAITELTEQSSSTAMTGSDSTPSRAPRSVRAARTARQHSTTSSSQRTWQAHAQQSTSSALLKYQRMRTLEREAEKLRNDQEIVEMSTHRRKRVKVSDLVTLPHHRPDESSSTFRVPDIDSDDEMEVDEDEPVRTNAFVMAQEQAQEQTAPEPRPKPAVQLTPASSPPVVQQTDVVASSSELTSTPVEQESFAEWYNKPAGPPADPAAAFWFDRFSLVFDQAGIPRRDPNDTLTDEEEAAECGRRFQAAFDQQQAEQSLTSP
nr:hypothetical protein CFP56_28771 [Quercus suber]